MLPRLSAILLSTALFFGALHLYSLHIDFPIAWHPDEPGKVSQILNDSRNFHHPQLLLEATQWATGWFDTPPTPQETVQTGRWCSAVFAATAVYALSWVGYATGGVIGMALMGLIVGLCPPLFTYAHYMKEDAALAVGVAIGVLGMAATATAGRWWTQLIGVAILGLGCAVATSGKYVGAASVVSVLLVPLIPWRHWTFAIGWPLVFTAALAVGILAINHRAFEEQTHFERSLEAESEHSVTEHFSLTMDRPNTFFVDTVRRQTQWPATGLAATYLLLLPIGLRRRTAWDGFIVLYAAFWLTILSYSVIYFTRYALPAVLGVHVIAGLGAIALVGVFRRWSGRAGGIVALAIALVVVVVQGRRVLIFNRQFIVANDTRTILADWVRNHVKPGEQVLAENYSGLGSADVPANIWMRTGAAELGSVESLRNRGIDYVVVADFWYERYFIPQVKPADGAEAGVARIRAFYDELFALTPVFVAAPRVKQEANTCPELRVYRLER